MSCVYAIIYVIFLANVQLARSFSKICVRNHQTFQNLCAESSKVCVWNHQDNFFFINVACRSDANLIKWHRAAMSGIKLQLQHKGGEDVSFVTTSPEMSTYSKWRTECLGWTQHGPRSAHEKWKKNASTKIKCWEYIFKFSGDSCLGGYRCGVGGILWPNVVTKYCMISYSPVEPP